MSAAVEVAAVIDGGTHALASVVATTATRSNMCAKRHWSSDGAAGASETATALADALAAASTRNSAAGMRLRACVGAGIAAAIVEAFDVMVDVEVAAAKAATSVGTAAAVVPVEPLAVAFCSRACNIHTIENTCEISENGIDGHAEGNIQLGTQPQKFGASIKYNVASIHVPALPPPLSLFLSLSLSLSNTHTHTLSQ
jgi:hypothetical protein